jgi:putative intracellular protease/amidase
MQRLCETARRPLTFLRRQAEGARYITSVRTGSLVLAAAGLLKGFRSACHRSVREELAAFGATPVAECVVATATASPAATIPFLGCGRGDSRFELAARVVSQPCDTMGESTP